MGTTAQKLQAVLKSKNAIRDKFNLPKNMPFSQYADNIKGGGETAFYKCSSVSGTILYTVRGAGYKAANGGYWDSGETWSDGGTAYPILTNGTCFMRYGDMGMMWSIFDSYSKGTWGKELYYLEGESDPTMPWWFVSDVEEPAPVVSNETSVSPITQIKVDGAGDTAYDGTYQIRNYNNEGYERSWLNATNMGYIVYDPSTNTWVICMSLGPDDEPDTIFYRSSATAENPWDGEWTKVSGSGSAPTVQYWGADTEVGEPKQIWSGYKAVLNDEEKYYTFEETLTEGLTYGNGFTPEKGKIYDAEAMIEARLILPLPTNGLIFYEPFNGTLKNNFTQLASSPEFFDMNGIRGMLVDHEHRLSLIADNLPSGNAPRSLSAMLYVTQTTSDWGFYIGYGGDDSNTFNIAVNGANFRNYNRDNSTDLGKVPTNTWCHVVMNFDGSTVRCYINGMLSGQYTKNYQTDVANYPLYVGYLATQSSSYFDQSGYIAAARLYNRALTEDEIQQLANEF